MIAAIRIEIEHLELDLALEADTRIQLHAMNEKLVDALREIQLTSDEFTRVVDEAQRVPRTGLVALVEKLKALVRQWRLFKSRQAGTIATGGTFGNDRHSDG